MRVTIKIIFMIRVTPQIPAGLSGSFRKGNLAQGFMYGNKEG